MLRHIGVFCLLIAAAAGLSFLLPLTVSAQTVFLGAVLLFIAYMGASYLLRSRREKPDG